jgi:rhamnopyranosyl-N-acetylglucosaminyl-diphospho-decaprenol beta-1,3/1,4-galactofuranosyltransferase
MSETVAVVVVTFNRADLLSEMLGALGEQTRRPDAVYVVDNASEDHTQEVLEAARTTGLPLHITHSPDNLGGAGGFHLGMRAAFEAGHDRIWLMDDDVLPAPECLETLARQQEPFVTAVREDPSGALIEKAATEFDLRNPLAIKPKRSAVEDQYDTREEMPERVELHNVAFEGPLIHRDVIAAIGLPDPAYFIFYDDADYAIRARRAGFRIWAIRDAVLRRQLHFDQQHDLAGWKGYYMYRNLFVVHFRYGENALVRAKPYLIAVAVALLSPLRGGPKEASNVLRALRDAHQMRKVPGNVV